MYLPKHFEISDPVSLREFMQAHPLATLVVADASGLSADHIPLMLTGNDAAGWKLAGHVARANPLWKKAESGIDCLAIFHGPQHYISPNWYATKKETGKVVPTWNYEVVHVRGWLRTVNDAEWLQDFLERLTETQEADQPAPWQMKDAPEDYIERMLEAVAGIEMEIVSTSGKAKVSQNQPLANRDSLMAALHLHGSEAALSMAQTVRKYQKGE